jgi:two-component system, OmpR family, response regulator TctD
VRILLAEDERPLAEWLLKALQPSGFRIDWFDDGALALRELLSHHDYDALVLDLGLPGRSGREVLAQLRRHDRRLPVLVLTARNSLSERIAVLNEGADDFMSKPFALPELEARLLALIRRSRGVEHPRLACGPLGFDGVSRQFMLNAEPLALSRREHTLLMNLVQRSGEPLTRQQIIDRVFADDDEVLPGAVDVIVHRLRKRLGNAGVRVSTYRGLGFVLEEARETEP